MTQARGRSRASGPAAVDRYLLPREREKPIITVRKHPAILIFPIALAVAGLVVAFLLTATVLSTNSTAQDAVWLLWVGLALNLVWQATNWAVDYFVVTSQRMMLTSGILTRKVGMMPLGKVTDMSFQRTLAGRLLGYGEFIVESAGQDQALSRIDYLPYPEHLYLEVCEMLWPQATPDCKMCNGSGNVMTVMPEERKLRAFPCPNCDGTGKAPPPTVQYDDDMADGGANPNTDPNED
jgi:membrane protein YdbS with pleckstrin-like domain